MRMSTPTRERIVQSSAELFRRQGFAGTGVKQIVAEASAPFGSLYHFFPGGKEQLGEEVIRSSGALYGQLIDVFFPPGANPVAATRAFFAGAAQTLVETGYADACPIATSVLSSPITARSRARRTPGRGRRGRRAGCGPEREDRPPVRRRRARP